MHPRPLRVVMLAALCGACAADQAAWLSRINAAETQRLEGLWRLEMSASNGVTKVAGSLALLVNHDEPPTFWHRSPAPIIGAYTLPLARLQLEALGAPTEVTAEARGDSVTLILNPQASGAEIWLTGAWQHDSITGNWTARARSGPTRGGRFVLHQP